MVLQFCKVKIPFGDALVIYIHKIGRRFAKNHTKNHTNPLRIPYNGDQLGLMVPYNDDRLGFTLFGCAHLPDGRAVNTLRKAVFARLRRERRLTRNRRSALLHLQSNENRNFSLLSLLESLNLCANFKLVMTF